MNPKQKEENLKNGKLRLKVSLEPQKLKILIAISSSKTINDLYGEIEENCKSINQIYRPIRVEKDGYAIFPSTKISDILEYDDEITAFDTTSNLNFTLETLVGKANEKKIEEIKENNEPEKSYINKKRLRNEDEQINSKIKLESKKDTGEGKKLEEKEKELKKTNQKEKNNNEEEDNKKIEAELQKIIKKTFEQNSKFEKKKKKEKNKLRKKDSHNQNNNHSNNQKNSNNHSKDQGSGNKNGSKKDICRISKDEKNEVNSDSEDSNIVRKVGKKVEILTETEVKYTELDQNNVYDDEFMNIIKKKN